MLQAGSLMLLSNSMLSFLVVNTLSYATLLSLSMLGCVIFRMVLVLNFGYIHFKSVLLIHSHYHFITSSINQIIFNQLFLPPTNGFINKLFLNFIFIIFLQQSRR